MARHASDVETAWTGCGPGYMGNKGGVGVRFRVKDGEGDAGETFTCVFLVCVGATTEHLSVHAVSSIAI